MAHVRLRHGNSLILPSNSLLLAVDRKGIDMPLTAGKQEVTIETPPADRSSANGNLIRIGIILSLLLATAMLFVVPASFAQVGISITIAPPALPVYEQPICPGDGYIWTPGYWAWDGEYYWVPGTWVMAPQIGFLWTPGYWGLGGSGFVFNEGYWGQSVGFYGGIDYGFGYFGHGYEGGRWENRHFFYNTAVNHVNASVIRNVYNTRATETTVNHVSYSGGNGGISARATAQEEAAARSRHIPPVAVQTQHAWAAHNTPQQRLSANQGKPSVFATPRPNTAVHPKELPPNAHPAPARTGDPNLDQNYQRQQQSLLAKQDQERQQLQQRQEAQHQQTSKQPANPATTQRVEQQHEQQTQQLEQKHSQQIQQMQQKQQKRQPAAGEGSRGGGRP
jgi:hypothetical protein